MTKSYTYWTMDTTFSLFCCEFWGGLGGWKLVSQLQTLCATCASSFTGFGYWKHCVVNCSSVLNLLECNFITSWFQILPFCPHSRKHTLLFFPTNNTIKTPRRGRGSVPSGWKPGFRLAPGGFRSPEKVP